MPLIIHPQLWQVDNATSLGIYNFVWECIEGIQCQNHDSLCSHSVKIEFTCRNNMGLISVLYVSCVCMHFYFKLHDLREWHPVCECVWICGYRCALKTKVFNLAATFLILALVFLVILPRAPYCSYAHGFSILLK